MTPANAAAITQGFEAGMISAAMIGVCAFFATERFLDLLSIWSWRWRLLARRNRMAVIRGRRMVSEAQQAVTRG